MSFLDEREEPPASSARQRPVGPADRQTLLVRRGMAAGAGVLVLILLVLGVRGCLDARKERSFKDYVRDARALVQESNQQGESLFGLLRNPGEGQGPVDIENNVNGFRAEAEQLAERARDLDHPGELDEANGHLVEVLEFRKDGIEAIAEQIPTALSEEPGNSTERIAGNMLFFLTSDVIFRARFLPALTGPLNEEELADEVELPASQFLPNVDWLQENVVAERIGGLGSGGGGAPEPGLHGTGLATVTAQPAGTALTPDAGPVEIVASEDLALEVQIANQGEHEEQDVTVTVTLSGGGRPIETEESLDVIAAGETKSVTIPLTRTPGTGQAVTISVEIEAVPGEQMTDNNSAEYRAVFTRG